MEAERQDQVAFYLTGRRSGTALAEVEGLELRPALLARYRDLTQLRYDYPLVLVDGAPADQSCLQSLSAIVDDVILQITPAEDGGRLTWYARRLEQAIREAVAAGATGRLSLLWGEAAARLMARGDDGHSDSLERVRAALAVDGAVVDCDRETADRIVQHVWSTVEAAKAARVRADIDTLILQLSNILRADFVRSASGRSPDRLRAAVGSADTKLFDFEAMSRLLSRSTAQSTLPESRRRRIEWLLAELKSQRFFAPPRGSTEAAAAPPPYAFEFVDCASALAAYRERLPEAIDLAKAIAMAELEIDSRYSEADHDPVFAGFGANGLDAGAAARFPSYLVCLEAAQVRGDERDTLLEMLGTGLPVKVLVRTDDIVDEPVVSGEGRQLTVGVGSRQLTGMAMSLNDVFVLQAAGSHLGRVRERLVAGLAGTCPAVLSVFSGASGGCGDVEPYLVSAAALESRAFPTFSYDPSAGDTWAQRFSLDGNPQADRDWPLRQLTFEDAEHQRVETTVAFTVADFVVCDRRFARHFARAPHASWSGDATPLDQSLDGPTEGMPKVVPSIIMVDERDYLQQVLVEDRVVRAARRSRDAWRSLQELGGIHNSHAERLLAREREVWEARLQQAAAAPAPSPIAIGEDTAPPPADAQATDTAAAEAEPTRSPDEAYVETARCTSCNECTQVNSKMFVYDENKQCHIADLRAGTYRELVEAAENCQVAIIHPGKPWNPNEPGLEDLIKRAEAFQ